MSEEGLPQSETVAKKRSSTMKKKYDDSNNRSYSSAKGFPYKKHNVQHNTESQVNNFRARYKEIAPEAQMLVDQIIDPEKQNNIVRFPSYGVSAVYQAENVLQAQYASDGRSAVAVSPILQNAILTTAGTSYTQTLNNVSSTNSNPYSLQYFNVGQSQTPQYWTAPIFFRGNNIAMPFPDSLTGRMMYPVGSTAVAASGTAMIGFQGPNIGVAGLYQVTIVWYDSNKTVLDTQTLVSNNLGVASLAFINLSQVGTRYLSFEISTPNLTPFEGNIFLSWWDTAGALVMSIQNHAQHMVAYDLTNAPTILDTAEQYTVTSQSLLLTYEGSSLNDNGALAIARIPGDSPVGNKGGICTASSWYQFIASLQRNKYEGATKHGGYAFYLGEDERSYFYRPVELLGFGTYPYLAAEFTTDPTTPQVVRIKVSTVVQFTTNSNIYDQKPSCWLGEDYRMIMYILSNINAAYDNPGHRAKLSAALKKMGAKVVSLLKNPKTYATLGSVIATLL